MSRPLPELADPVHLCAGGRSFSGTLPLAGLERLGQRLAGEAGELRFTLEFGRDERDISIVRGRLETVLPLACERCREVFEFPVDREWTLGVAQSLDEADRLPDDLEPLLVGEERIRLSDILEEELLLALPLVPRHPDAEGCSADTEFGDEASEEQESDQDGPFAVLEQLRKKDKDSGE